MQGSTFFKLDGPRVMFILLGATAILAAGFLAAMEPQYLAIGIAGILGMLVIPYPMLGFFFYIPSGMFLSGFYVLFFPLRYYVLGALIMSLLFHLMARKSRVKINSMTRGMMIVSFIYLIWVFIRELQYNSSIFDAIHFFVGNILSGFLAACLILFLVNTEKKIRYFLWFLIGWVTLSALVGFMQFLKVPAFVQLGNLVFQFVSNEDAQTEALLTRGPGVIGLTGLSLIFAYTVSFIVPLVLSISLSRQVGSTAALFLRLLVGLLMAALAVSLVMSSVLGAIIAIGLVIRLWSARHIGRWIFGLFVIIASIVVAETLVPNIFADRILDRDGLARLPLVLVGLSVALDFPFGLARPRYLSIARIYAIQVAHYSGSEFVFNSSAHNNFVDVLVAYGFPALLLYVIFYCMMWAEVRRLWQYASVKQDESLKALSAGLIGSFAVAFFNSLVHNSGLFMGESIAWFGVGILWSLSSLVAQKTAVARA